MTRGVRRPATALAGRAALVLLAATAGAAAVTPQAGPAGPAGGTSAEATGDRAAGADLERLQAWLDGTRDLEARFEQQIVSGALGAGPAESGRLWLVRPGTMRWDYRKPERKVAIVEGTRSRFWIAEDRQLWEGRLAGSDDALATLLLGRRPLAEIFEACHVAGEEGAGPRLALRPREGSERFEEVVLTLDEATGSIVSAEVADVTGNRILYRFRGIRRNRGVDPGVFEFEPPPGTEIVQVP